MKATSSSKAAPAKAAKKAPAKAPAKKAAPAAKAPAKKAPAKAAPAKKAPAKAAAAKAAPAKKAPAKSASASSRSAAEKAAPARKGLSNETRAAKAASAKASVSGADGRSAPARRAGGLTLGGRVPEGERLTKSPFDAKFLAAQRQVLVDERATYTRQAESLEAEAESLTADREPGDVQFDEESGEGSSIAVERERDLALSAQARAAIEEIDAALGRLDDGVYGICAVSGQAIPKERLEAIPWATERVEYKVGGFGRR